MKQLTDATVRPGLIVDGGSASRGQAGQPRRRAAGRLAAVALAAASPCSAGAGNAAAPSLPRHARSAMLARDSGDQPVSRHAHGHRAKRFHGEDAFIAENAAAMSKMMKGMAIKPSGDVDRDFVDMMVPHHQGAIAMALAVLRYGHNPQVRRLAQEIIVDQQQEIAAMRLAVGEPLPPAAPAPTGTPPPKANPMSGMDMK